MDEHVIFMKNTFLDPNSEKTKKARQCQTTQYPIPCDEKITGLRNMLKTHSFSTQFCFIEEENFGTQIQLT